MQILVVTYLSTCCLRNERDQRFFLALPPTYCPVHFYQEHVHPVNFRMPRAFPVIFCSQHPSSSATSTDVEGNLQVNIQHKWLIRIIPNKQL